MFHEGSGGIGGVAQCKKEQFVQCTRASIDCLDGELLNPMWQLWQYPTTIYSHWRTWNKKKTIYPSIPTTRAVPATMEWIDVAGLRRGAGLGNRFLTTIRDCHGPFATWCVCFPVATAAVVPGRQLFIT